ncbi:alpha/beta fold hydrolase [Micromonospora sp. WMMD964]|nr:alpha/beta fold hydrolase [Micromonospora sp. WMMD964]WFE98622.1 alpha/beta fold hydrolase [Micromonospora sp. WMMD964]
MDEADGDSLGPPRVWCCPLARTPPEATGGCTVSCPPRHPIEWLVHGRRRLPCPVWSPEPIAPGGGVLGGSWTAGEASPVRIGTRARLDITRPVGPSDHLLVCLPPAGAGAALFRPWARKVPERLIVAGVDLPGRGSLRGEPLRPVGDWTSLVRDIVTSISTVDCASVILFGHSMGALTAFLVARGLEAAGRPSSHVFLSAGRPPTRPALHGHLASATPAELVAAELLPSGVLEHVDLVDLLVPLLRHDLELLGRYEHQDLTLSSPVTLIAGEHDAVTTVEEVQGWHEVLTGDVGFVKLPEGHALSDRLRAEVVRRIQDGWL